MKLLLIPCFLAGLLGYEPPYAPLVPDEKLPSKQASKHSDWSVWPEWNSGFEERRYCSISAVPVFIFDVRAKPLPVVSVNFGRGPPDLKIRLGYEAKLDTELQAVVGETRYALSLIGKITTARRRQDTASLQDSSIVTEFLTTLRDGDFLTIVGTDQSGKLVSEVYNLETFEGALEQVRRTCGR